MKKILLSLVLVSTIFVGCSKNNDDVLTGRTDSYKVVNFKGDKSLIGRMVDVKIDENHVWYLSGICDNI